MTFTTAIKTCLSKYVTFSGRARRPEYWWFVLFVFLGAVLLSIIDAIVFGTNPETGEPSQFLTPLFQFATLLPMLAAGWRRMHDVGYPGWYLLLPLAISFAMMLFLFSGVAVFALMEGRVDDPEVLRGPAAFLGLSGLIAAALLQLALSILILWWLTRPSQPEANAYGEPV